MLHKPFSYPQNMLIMIINLTQTDLKQKQVVNEKGFGRPKRGALAAQRPSSGAELWTLLLHF